MPRFSFMTTILKRFSHVHKALRLNDLHRPDHAKCRFFWGWHTVCCVNLRKCLREKGLRKRGNVFGVSPCRRTTYNNYSKQIPCQHAHYLALYYLDHAHYLARLYLDHANLSLALFDALLFSSYLFLP